MDHLYYMNPMDVWLPFIIVVALVAIGSSVGVGIVAQDRHGRNGVAWFLLAICISPLMALLFLIAAGRPAPVMAGDAAAPKPQFSGAPQYVCSRCGSAVRPEETDCPDCGHQGRRRVVAEVSA